MFISRTGPLACLSPFPVQFISRLHHWGQCLTGSPNQIHRGYKSLWNNLLIQWEVRIPSKHHWQKKWKRPGTVRNLGNEKFVSTISASMQWGTFSKNVKVTTLMFLFVWCFNRTLTIYNLWTHPDYMGFVILDLWSL